MIGRTFSFLGLRWLSVLLLSLLWTTMDSSAALAEYDATSQFPAAKGGAVEFAGGTQPFVADLSHVTGKAAVSRNRAIDAVIKEDFRGLNLAHKPQYSPFISQGVAMEGAGTHIGKNMFSSRAALRDTIVHEELHHRWWSRGVYNHHPAGSALETKFYNTIERYNRMRGWSTP
jgi:hypothetical protein